MATIRNKIVIAQRIWGLDNYIAYYDDGSAAMFTSAEDDEQLSEFVRSCATSGCSKTVEFPIQTGAQTKVKCRQTIYCRHLVPGGAGSVVESATGFISGIVKGGITCVVWSPTRQSMTIHEGFSKKSIHVEVLSNAPKAVWDFMQSCTGEGYTLKRVYRATESGKVATVEEFLFSKRRPPREFAGTSADQITYEELVQFGFKV